MIRLPFIDQSIQLRKRFEHSRIVLRIDRLSQITIGASNIFPERPAFARVHSTEQVDQSGVDQRYALVQIEQLRVSNGVLVGSLHPRRKRLQHPHVAPVLEMDACRSARRPAAVITTDLISFDGGLLATLPGRFTDGFTLRHEVIRSLWGCHAEEQVLRGGVGEASPANDGGHDCGRSNAAHRHAEVLAPRGDNHVGRFGDPADGVCNLSDETFLNLQIMSVIVGDAGELAQPDDARLRVIADGDVAPERQQMMLAQRPDPDSRDGDEFARRDRRKCRVQLARVEIEKFPPPSSHARRSVAQPLARAILTKCLQQFADEVFDAIKVYRTSMYLCI